MFDVVVECFGFWMYFVGCGVVVEYFVVGCIVDGVDVYLVVFVEGFFDYCGELWLWLE